MRVLLLLTALGALACQEEVTPPETLFAQHCASCHGDDGRGEPRRRQLEVGLDLTASELVQGGADGLVFRSIAYGYEGMPAFSHKLALEEMQALTHYVLGFDANRSPESSGNDLHGE